GFQQPEILLAPPPGVSPILDYMIFPNPAVTTVKISFQLMTDVAVTILLVNTAGQVIFSDVRHYGPGKIVISQPVDKLASGIYTVVFKVAGRVYTEKLIVQ
ncbi:T9SS type A sorting domain-containing protein, partial [Chitinophaga lutea]